MKNFKLMLMVLSVFFPAIIIGQTADIFYYPKLIQVEDNLARSSFLPRSTSWGVVSEDILFFDDRIEFHFKKLIKNKLKRSCKGGLIDIAVNKEPALIYSIYFADMMKCPVVVTKLPSVFSTVSAKALVVEFDYIIKLFDCTIYSRNFFSDCQYYVSNNAVAPNFNFDETYRKQDKAATEEAVIGLADYLYSLQHKYSIKYYDSLINTFKPLAEQYISLTVKPPISEEQRKLIVQANALNDQKMYDRAIETYTKVIDVNQTAYPAAYSNVALICALQKRYNTAIFYMKKYLMLVPDAEDARSAQDKIYEWEAFINK